MKRTLAASIHQETGEGIAASADPQFTTRPEGNAIRLEDYALEQLGRKISVKKILVPTDFCAASANALEVAVSIGHQYGSSLSVLHVIDILSPMVCGDAGSLMEDLWAEKTAKMEQLSRSLSGRVAARTILAEGLPWEEITLRSHDFDLLVLGTRRCKSDWNCFRQHTSSRVIENAQCPVLTISEQQAVEKLAWRTSLSSETLPGSRITASGT